MDLAQVHLAGGVGELDPVGHRHGRGAGGHREQDLDEQGQQGDGSCLPLMGHGGSLTVGGQREQRIPDLFDICQCL